MSSKNRRKLLRKINVNDIQYFWCVVDYDCDGDGSSRFQIWKNKQKIFEELICGETITPKIVREKILNIEEVYLIDPPYGLDLANMNMGIGKSKKASKIQNRKWKKVKIQHKLQLTYIQC